MTKFFSKTLLKFIGATALVALSCQEMNAAEIQSDPQTQQKSRSSWLPNWGVFGYGQQQQITIQETTPVSVPTKKSPFKLVLWFDAWDGDYTFEGGKGTNSISTSDPLMVKKTALNFLNSGKFETTLSIEDDRGEIRKTEEWVSFLQSITQLDHLEVSPGFKKSESYQVIVDALKQIPVLKSLKWRVSQVEDDATKPFQLICEHYAASLESIHLISDLFGDKSFSYFSKFSMVPEFPNLKIVNYDDGSCSEKMYLDFIEFLSQVPNLECLYLPGIYYKDPTEKVFELLEEVLKTKINLKDISFASSMGCMSHIVNIIKFHALQSVRFGRNFVQVENWQSLANALKGAAQIKDLVFMGGAFSFDQSKDMKLESLAEMSSLESLSFGSEIGKSANQVNGLVQALLKRPTPLGFLQISVSEETIPLFTDLLLKGTEVRFTY